MPVCARCQRDAPDGALYCPYCSSPIVPAQPDGGPADPLIGQTIKGTYFVQQVLGGGGMGRVYKAIQVAMDRPVALKLLHQGLASNASVVQRFHREARAASRLRHEHVISVFDFGQADDGTLYLAMELVPGRNLLALAQEEFPLGEERVVSIAAQILGALAEAHGKGVVHRDLKPENVMVEVRRENPDFVTVLDFGIAKIQEPGEAQGTLTQAGVICGTPDFMSPEQATQGSVDGRSDLYSLGVILYELLAGKRPFEARSQSEMLQMHLAEPPPPIGRRAPGAEVSPALERLVLRALEKDPDHRFAGAEEMRAELLACTLDPRLARRRAPAAARPTVVLDGGPRPPSRPGTPPGGRASPEPVPTPTTRIAPAPARPGTPPPAGSFDPPPLEGGRPETGRRGLLVLGAVGGAFALGAVLWSLAGRSGASPSPSGIGRVDPATVAAPDRAPPAVAGKQPEARLVQPEASSATIAAGEPHRAGGPAEPAPGAGPGGRPRPAPGLDLAGRPEAARRTARKALDGPAPAPGSGPQPAVLQESAMLGLLPRPTAQSGQGILAVSSEPPGDVVVNGRDHGETPRELRVVAGTYDVKVHHPTYGWRRKRIVVRAGARQLWQCDFARTGSAAPAR